MIKSPIQVDFSIVFNKQLKKAPTNIKIAFRKRLLFFLQNQYYPILNNHALTGRLKGYRSINVTGDWRAIYSIETKRNKESTILFELLGTHGQLYK